MTNIASRQAGLGCLIASLVLPWIVSTGCGDSSGRSIKAPRDASLDHAIDGEAGSTIDSSVEAEASVDMDSASQTDASDAGADANEGSDAADTSDAQGDAPSIIVGCIPQEISTRYDATWLFGHGCRADWNAANQVTFSASPVNFAGIEGTIAAANADSGVLFAASDGIDLYNSVGLKTNDAALGANVSTSQPVAFVGKPGSTTDFYVVTNAANSGASAPAGLFVSSLACGTLVPTGAPALIPNTQDYTEALATVRHANGTDRWILSVAPGGIAVLPVTAGGIGSPSVTPWGGTLGELTAGQRAFIAIAHDRRTFAITAEGHGALLGSFDSSTGTISGLTPITLPSTSTLYSAAFSPDRTKLYFSEWSGKYWQVDRTDGNAVVDLGASSGALRTAIDGKIYGASNGASSLRVVTNPNLSAAQLSITSAVLPSGCTSSYGLPGMGDL